MKKSLYYAYPDSPIAQKYGYLESGVWYVTVNGYLQATFIGDCKTSKDFALNYFEWLPFEVDTSESFTRESLPFKDHD